MNKYFLFLISLLFFFDKSYSKGVSYSDAGMWNTFSIEKKLNKKFSLSLEEEIRFKENFSQLNLFYTNLGINYKINKKFKFSIIYRNTQKVNFERGWDIKHRIMFDLTYKQKIKNNFYLQLRERIQLENKNIYSSEDGKDIESFSRTKIELGYNIKWNLKAYLSEEMRFQLFDPRNTESNYSLHRFRQAVGFDYKIDFRNTIGIYYLVQLERAVYRPNNLYIVGLEYSIDL